MEAALGAEPQLGGGRYDWVWVVGEVVGLEDWVWGPGWWYCVCCECVLSRV